MDMMESIIMMCLVIVTTILGSWLDPPSTFETAWIDRNLQPRMAEGSMPSGCCLPSFNANDYHNKLHIVRMTLNIGANFFLVKILNYKLHERHTQSSFAATRHFP
jgi:hypothetical protein